MTDQKEPGVFSSLFLERLDDIERRAQKIGLTITHVCRDSGVARATPDRWRANVPKSVKLMDDLEKAIIAAEQKAGPAEQVDQ